MSLTVTKATPALTWPKPAPITYGAALSAAQLNAVASVPGRFAYSPAVGEVLQAGAQTLTATFTPTDGTKYATAQAAVSLTVAKAMPVITWPKPADITYGTALSAGQLNAVASVEGRFTYAPAVGDVLPAGVQTLTATFTPTDSTDFATADATVTIAVGKATPAIIWTKPASIAYGAALGAAQLNAKASVPGTFTYQPAAGSVLTAGTHRLSAVFTPADAANYTTAQSAVSFAVTHATPAIAWPKPDPITYGVTLSAAQLNATASVEGSFAYIPGIGALLTAGSHRPSVTFTPADATNYTVAQAAVQLTVGKATPTIAWETPSDITYGDALSDAQLHATASIPGTFAYTPAAGAMLTPGAQTLSVTFTPADSADYTTAQASVRLNVNQAKATVLTWQAPADISYGTALSASQLNATAPVPGMFEYAPAAGDILPVGVHTLSVTFTPADPNLPAAQTTVPISITKATPAITWPKPADIVYGTALGADQLNAMAPIEGTFTYTPAAGEVLGAGTRTLSATFIPEGTADYETAQASVSLTVAKATPAIAWPNPNPIPYGSALGSDQLNATASVEGTFTYIPGIGNVLTAGKQTLLATFAPGDSADYNTAQATVPLLVEGLPEIEPAGPEAADEETEDRLDAYRDHSLNMNDEKSGAESKTPAEGMAPTAGTQRPSTPTETEDRTEVPDARRGSMQSGKAPVPQAKQETRSYKGATYVKGADGQWHLQQK